MIVARAILLVIAIYFVLNLVFTGNLFTHQDYAAFRGAGSYLDRLIFSDLRSYLHPHIPFLPKLWNEVPLFLRVLVCIPLWIVVDLILFRKLKDGWSDVLVREVLIVSGLVLIANLIFTGSFFTLEDERTLRAISEALTGSGKESGMFSIPLYPSWNGLEWYIRFPICFALCGFLFASYIFLKRRYGARLVALLDRLKKKLFQKPAPRPVGSYGPSEIYYFDEGYGYGYGTGYYYASGEWTLEKDKLTVHIDDEGNVRRVKRERVIRDPYGGILKIKVDVKD